MTHLLRIKLMLSTAIVTAFQLPAVAQSADSGREPTDGDQKSPTDAGRVHLGLEVPVVRHSEYAIVDSVSAGPRAGLKYGYTYARRSWEGQGPHGPLASERHTLSLVGGAAVRWHLLSTAYLTTGAEVAHTDGGYDECSTLDRPVETDYSWSAEASIGLGIKL
jgi:hypothetical protein